MPTFPDRIQADTDGPALFIHDRAPAETDGQTGDLWINAATSTTYGPKAAGSWAVSTLNSAATEVRGSFAANAAGFPVNPDKGVAWNLYGGTVGLTARPTVVSGKLTQAVTPAASYAHLALAGSCRRIGARWTFSSFSTNDGSAVLGALTTPYAGGAVPDSPCHLAITPTHAIYGVWSGGSMTTVATIPLVTALVAATVYTAEVYIDAATSRAVCFLPDGTVHVVAHALIGTVAGDVAFWEIFTVAGTDSVAQFTEVWADSTDPSPVAAAFALCSQTKRAVQYNPTGVADAFVPTTSTALDAASLTITTTYPPSGKLLISCSANYRVLSTGQRMFWDFYFGVTNQATIEPMTDQPADDYTATRTGRIILSGTPGATVTLQWRHRALASSQVIWMVETFRPAVMTVEPVI